MLRLWWVTIIIVMMSIEIITIIVTCLILANNYNNNNNMLLILAETPSPCSEKKPTIILKLNSLKITAISIPITIITIKIALTIITTNNLTHKDILHKKTLSSNTQEIKIPVSYITIKLNPHPIWDLILIVKILLLLNIMYHLPAQLLIKKITLLILITNWVLSNPHHLKLLNTKQAWTHPLISPVSTPASMLSGMVLQDPPHSLTYPYKIETKWVNLSNKDSKKSSNSKISQNLFLST